MAQYKNIKTGFIFETECELHGEDWEKLSPSPVISEDVPKEDSEVVEEKPVNKKRKRYE
jgi:hypothetical protein